MYIFLDESGTHKQTGRSAIALVCLTIDNIDLFQDALVKAEQGMRIIGFHWSHSSWKIKEKFIYALSKQDFMIKILITKNPFRDEYYHIALRELVTEKDVKAIIVDGKKERSYDRKLKKLFRDKNIGARKLRTANDESYPALRAADAIAGLVRYMQDSPENELANTMYQKIAKKITTIIEL